MRHGDCSSKVKKDTFMHITRILLVIPALIFWACQSGIKEKTQQQLKERVQSHEKLDEVYASLEYQPIWVHSSGLNKNGKGFMEQLDQVVYDGLEKEAYNHEGLKELIAIVSEKDGDEKLVDLELEMSESFMLLASDLHLGRINPEQLSSQWKIERKKPEYDLEDVLIQVRQGKSDGVKKVLAELRPDNPQYDQLRDMLEVYLSMEEVPDQEVQIDFEGAIEPGEEHEAIPEIRKVLLAQGYLEAYEPKDNMVYDEQLLRAVQTFQIKHGLNEDGVLGEEFKEAIRYQRQDVITKLRVNLERLRWLPDFTSGGKPKVIVNIPNFYMDYIEGEDTVFTSKVVVGKEYRQTPVFSSQMSYLVFSPTWTLPETILWNDVIPAVQKDRGYLKANNMVVINSNGEEINENSIKWKQLKDENDFPYMIQQAPGDDNALGRVKFMFPNDYSIYIHDSPAKNLYDKDERTFSSGCIRMERPEDFAALLLEGEWDRDDIKEAMSRNEEKQVNLKRQPDVWILYLTAWCGKGGLQIREDVYDSDIKIAQLMNIKPSKTYY